MRFFISLLCAITLTLHADAQYDKRLVFSTYQGGNRNDDAVSVAVDTNGFLYIAGESESLDLAGTPVGEKPLTSGVFRGYLTKYAPNGKQVVWRAIIGGSSNSVPHAVALDPDGNVYVAGTTGARDFPLKNPVQDTQTGLNIAFLMKFSKDGNLLFSTYFGGDRNEEGLALAIDSQGAIYLAGRATSTNLPVQNALQPKLAGGGQDGFIAKFTKDYKLAYATYLGGTSGTDNIYSIAVGPDDSLYVTGESMSPDMATEGAYITQAQSYSSYLAKITPSGDAISYFTYIGWRGGYTSAQAVTIDSAGRAYVAGHTTSKQLPTSDNAVQPKYAGGFRDAFLLRLDADGNTAEHLTYLGGSFNGASDPDETAVAIRLDSHGFVYVTGETSSSDFANVRSIQTTHGGVHDAYLLRLDLDNGRLLSSTFWGGAKKDAALAVALGPGEVATFVGETSSEDFPTSNALQTKPGSSNDSFVAQVCDPWLSASAVPGLNYTIGGDRPQQFEIEVTTGCPQAFDVTETAVSESWVNVASEGRTAPMRLKVGICPDGLPSGEYKTTIRVTVPEAVQPTLEIPIVLTVVEPTTSEQNESPSR